MVPIQKKIFVVGSGRCGTTWLSTWLRQHPDIFGGPETHLFSILQPLVNKEWNQGLKTWVPDEFIVDNIRNFVLAMFANSKNRDNKPHCVEHSYCHYGNIDFIQQVFPDAYFIHLYRDGRNVVESWLRVNPLNHSIDYYINSWMSIMNDMLSRPSSPNILHLKYETLMEHPATSNEITKFLGIEHHKDIDSWRFPINTPNFEYDYDRWMKRLSKEDQAKLQVMNELLEKLKYYPRLPRMNKSEVLAQLELIAPYLKDVEWVVVGSASLVLQGVKADAKDIDIVQLSGEPVNIDKPYKQNIISRMYRDLRMDLHYNFEDNSKNKFPVQSGLHYADKKYRINVSGFNIQSEQGIMLSQWLLHYFVYQEKRVLEDSVKVMSPQGEDKAALKTILGDLYDHIESRVNICRNNASAIERKLYQ